MYLHLISKSKAKEIGLRYHFTGSVCKHGNIDARYTANGGCMCGECVKKRKETAAKADRNHWDSKLARAARYRDKNRQAINARMRTYSVVRSHVRAAYVDNNRTLIAEKAKKFRSENMNVHRVYVANRRAARIQRTPKWSGGFDLFVVSEAAHLCILRAQATGVIWHIDHCIPLRAIEASGLHCAQNLQVIPGYVNNHKKNRMMATEPYEWCNFI